ncbi:MAG TPA: hypothetical protein VF781_02980 [Solirubrobacteraceae bacterium]
MTTAHTQVEILDRSVEKAHVWINDVAQELGSDDRHQAHRVLSRHISGGEARSVLHVLPAHLRELLDPGPDEPARAD